MADFIEMYEKLPVKIAYKLFGRPVKLDKLKKNIQITFKLGKLV